VRATAGQHDIPIPYFRKCECRLPLTSPTVSFWYSLHELHAANTVLATRLSIGASPSQSWYLLPGVEGKRGVGLQWQEGRDFNTCGETARTGGPTRVNLIRGCDLALPRKPPPTALCNAAHTRSLNFCPGKNDPHKITYATWKVTDLFAFWHKARGQTVDDSEPEHLLSNTDRDGPGQPYRLQRTTPSTAQHKTQCAGLQTASSVPVCCWIGGASQSIFAPLGPFPSRVKFLIGGRTESNIFD